MSAWCRGAAPRRLGLDRWEWNTAAATAVAIATRIHGSRSYFVPHAWLFLVGSALFSLLFGSWIRHQDTGWASVVWIGQRRLSNTISTCLPLIQNHSNLHSCSRYESCWFSVSDYQLDPWHLPTLWLWVLHLYHIVQKWYWHRYPHHCLDS